MSVERQMAQASALSELIKNLGIDPSKNSEELKIANHQNYSNKNLIGSELSSTPAYQQISLK